MGQAFEDPIFGELDFYDLSVSDLLSKENLIVKESEKESVDWTKLANYIEMNGWNQFAQFLNAKQSENETHKYELPSFLPSVPAKRSKSDRPKAIALQNETNAFKHYRISQRVSFEPVRFLSNG